MFMFCKRYIIYLLLITVTQLCVACGDFYLFDGVNPSNTAGVFGKQTPETPPDSLRVYANEATTKALKDFPQSDSVVSSDSVNAQTLSFAPSLGLNDRLFDFRVRDGKQRFLRLEREVQKIYNDVQKIIPLLDRQLRLQDDVESILTRLRLQVDTPPAIPVASVSRDNISPSIASRDTNAGRPRDLPPDSIQTSSNQISDSQDLSPSAINLLNVRFADYPDKVRLVLESSAAQDFKIDFDEENQILLLSSSKGFYTSNLKSKRLRSTFIDDFALSGEDGAFEIVLSLKDIQSIEKSFVIKPNKDNSRFRTVIDLSNADLVTK